MRERLTSLSLSLSLLFPFFGGEGPASSWFPQSDAPPEQHTHTHTRTHARILFGFPTCTRVLTSACNPMLRPIDVFRPVAIKEMICTGVSERDLQHKCEELRREAELLAGFSHRNIARLYGIMTTMPAVSLVMEYAAGGSLSTALQDNFLDQRIVLDWALQIAKGLNYLHNDSPTAVVHRDLKSQNVLLSKANVDGKAIIDGNTLKITDFGTEAWTISHGVVNAISPHPRRVIYLTLRPNWAGF